MLKDAVRSHGSELATVESNAAALALFSGTIGPSVGLKDAAGTVNAKGLPAKLSQELGVDELAHTAQQLVAALAVWQFADTAGAAAGNGTLTEAPSTTRQAWLTSHGLFVALPALLQSLSTAGSSDLPDVSRQIQRAELARAASQVALEASQSAMDAWWGLHEWKDRVRLARGRARLCGSWQWVIHNHQNHGEQKTVMTFPPAGQEKPAPPLPAEIVVLGDNIYLRWEADGRIQEDSLLFVKEGTRIEGSFVNNLGGWGSITGKRIGTCQP